MRIVITTMEDPLYLTSMIKKIIQKRKNDIVGVIISSRGRFTVYNQSRVRYLISLLLITGINRFIGFGIRKVWFEMQEILSRLFPCIEGFSIQAYCKQENIPVWKVEGLQNRETIAVLRSLRPDIIINQAQDILGKEFLAIPTIGVISRHNSLLPKNRGRLSPFWILYKREKRAGVSIHFVEEKVDSGDIIVQKSLPVEANETFNTLLEKCYAVAPAAFLEALEIIEKGDWTVIPNRDEEATANSIPSIKEAWRYRRRTWRNLFNPRLCS